MPFDWLRFASEMAATDANIGGSILNYFATKETNKQMMDFSRESAAKQQEYAKELLDYNSPAYQMQRIVQAGLNPNLVYDNLDTPVPTGAHADTPQLKAPQVDFGVDEALKVAQIDRLNAATDNETAKTLAENKSLYKGMELKDAQIDALQTQANLMAKTIEEKDNIISLMSIEKRIKTFDLYQKKQFFRPTMNILMNEMKMSGIQAENLSKYLASSILLNVRQAENYLAQSKLAKVEEGVFRSLASLYSSQKTAIDQENTLRNFDVSAANSYDWNHQKRGYNTAINRLEAKNDKYSIIGKQKDLIEQYGNAEHVVNLILNGCRAFESATQGIMNVSSTILDWVPSIKDIRSITTGNVKKTTSKTKRGK